MSKVYLINVGANTGHRSIARCPIFEDDSFIFVPFPHRGTHGLSPCPKLAQPFLHNMDPRDVHDDPNWEDRTYGDGCSNPRAYALKKVQPNDILLFWSLLWRNEGNNWQGFTNEHGWYFIGALRVQEILGPGQKADEASAPNRVRAARCVHFSKPGARLKGENRVFIGDKHYPAPFEKAVNFQVEQEHKGLIYRTVRTAKGHQLNRYGKDNWSSSTRSCRVIWDLEKPEQLERARIATKAIKDCTGYDLLKHMA